MAPSPRYCIRQARRRSPDNPAGWYMFPLIYDYAWEQYWSHATFLTKPPIWAKPVDLNRLTFETPLEQTVS